MESKKDSGNTYRVTHQDAPCYPEVGDIVTSRREDKDGIWIDGQEGCSYLMWNEVERIDPEQAAINKRLGTEGGEVIYTKDTNPKDAIGSTKLPLNLVPDTLKTYAALAFAEGAFKYGAFNWRVAGVRASIYKAALERHLAKYWNGEWADPVTGVPHLASVIACAGIILDANAAGKLTDDRPPAIPLSGIIDNLDPAIAHLKELFKDKHPHHHTEADKLGPVIPK